MKKRTPALRWSINRASAEFGLDRRTLEKRLLAADTKPGADGKFSTRAIAGAVFGDRTSAETRLALAKAEIAELELGTRRGELLEAEDVRRAWSAVVVSTRQKILAIPNKAESRHVDGMTARQLREMLEVEVREALEEMSIAPDYDLGASADGVEDDDENARVEN